MARRYAQLASFLLVSHSSSTGHFSTVEIDLKEKKGKTILTLTQKDVPADDAARTEEGWVRNLWARGKMMFGFGNPQIY